MCVGRNDGLYLATCSYAYPIAIINDRAPGAKWGNRAAQMLTERYKEAVVVNPMFFREFFSKDGLCFIRGFGFYVTKTV